MVSRKMQVAALLALLILLIGVIGCSGKQAASDSAKPGDSTGQQAASDSTSSRNPGQGSANRRGPGSQRPNGTGPRTGGGVNESYAAVLGLNPEQLQAEFKAGKQLPQVVSEHGMNMEQFNQKVLDSEKTRMAQEVKDGKLTQEQADQSFQALQKRLANPGGSNNQQPN